MSTLLFAIALFLASSASVMAYDVGIPAGGEPAKRLHVTLDATFTYGIGGYSALGAQLRGRGQLPLGNLGRSTGTFDFGLVLGIQDEPQALQYGAPPALSNDAQRLNAWVTVGHSFHMGQKRRASLGMYLYGGWTQVWSQAAMNDDAHDFHRSFSDSYGKPNAGGMLTFDYRFSTYLGFTLQAAAPFPVGPSYVITLFHVGVGLTGYVL